MNDGNNQMEWNYGREWQLGSSKRFFSVCLLIYTRDVCGCCVCGCAPICLKDTWTIYQTLLGSLDLKYGMRTMIYCTWLWFSILQTFLLSLIGCINLQSRPLVTMSYALRGVVKLISIYKCLIITVLKTWTHHKSTSNNYFL